MAEPNGANAAVGANGGDRTGAGERVAIVDGSNVAYSTEGGGPKLENILLVSQKLRDEGYRPVVLVDAALRHNIDRRAEFERLVDDGAIKQAPPGTDADYFILSFARDLQAPVVSNDRFKDRRQAFPEASERVIRYMILDRDVVLERRSPRRGNGGSASAQAGGGARTGGEGDAGPRTGAAQRG